MPRFTILVLGQELTINADATSEEIEQAAAYVEKRYNDLYRGGHNVNSQRVLTALTLSLAGDLLQARRKADETQARLDALLETIERDT